jgi:Terpene synthase family 2, C-terminal metal binding
MPFPARVSPDLDGVRERTLRWAHRFGLVTGPVDEDRFRSWDIAGLMARWAPLATGTALDLTVDGTNALTLLDDQFDGQLACQPAEVARVCATFRDVLCAVPGTVPPGAGPLAHAWADVWARNCAGRSVYWRARETVYWRWYLEACVEETRDRARGEVPTSDAYLAQRRKSGIVYPMIGMTEAAYGFEVSRRAYGTHPLPRMVEVAVDVVNSTNDVYSLEKEVSRGDVHNLVLVLVVLC